MHEGINLIKAKQIWRNIKTEKSGAPFFICSVQEGDVIIERFIKIDVIIAVVYTP